MRGRLFTLCLSAAAASGCLSVLAPDVDRSLQVHAAVHETSAPAACLGCHRPEPVKPVALPEFDAGLAPTEAPWVPRWMLHERAGECLACHGVGP